MKRGLDDTPVLPHKPAETPGKMTDINTLMKITPCWDLVGELVSDRRFNGIHGEKHWRQVMENGYHLAANMEGVDTMVVNLFGCFHDSCRHDDGQDPEHGPRAAAWIETLRYTYLAIMTDGEFAMLQQAIREHTSRTEPSGCPTVDACIDADRLDLVRIGILPDPDRMLTEEGRRMAREIRSAAPRYVKGDVIEHVKMTVLPRYDYLDRAHNRDHAVAVINECCRLAERYDVDPLMAFVAAAYHDIGLKFGRELHHLASAQMLYDDIELRRWFSHSDICTMRDAIEDHRAGSKREPRSELGRILHEADLQLEPDTVLSRALSYRLADGATFDSVFGPAYDHLVQKYGPEGYIHICMPEGEENQAHLGELRLLIGDREACRARCQVLFDQLSKQQKA